MEHPGVVHNRGMVVGFVGVGGDTRKRTERKSGAAQVSL